MIYSIKSNIYLINRINRIYSHIIAYIEYMRIMPIYANYSIWIHSISILCEYIRIEYMRIEFMRIWTSHSYRMYSHKFAMRIYANIFDRNMLVHIRINSHIFAIRIYLNGRISYSTMLRIEARMLFRVLGKS